MNRSEAPRGSKETSGSSINETRPAVEQRVSAQDVSLYAFYIQAGLTHEEVLNRVAKQASQRK